MHIEPLSPTIGARITGVDLNRLDDDTFRAIEEAWTRHKVVGIAGQSLTPAAFHAFACRLGRPQPHVLDAYHHAANPDIMVLSNVIEPDGRRRGLADGGSYWHSDYSYKELPAKATLLYSLECPADGGDTHFLDMEEAYAALPERIRRRIEPLWAVHNYEYRHRQQITQHGVRTELSAQQRALTPDVRHPVVRRHPASGRPALYLNPGFTVRLEGVPQEESDSLLAEIFDIVLKPERVFAYKWSLGDVAFWDNRCVMHSATQGHRQNRTLWRITVLAEPPIPWAEDAPRTETVAA